jgi:hypothetical protein
MFTNHYFVNTQTEMAIKINIIIPLLKKNRELTSTRLTSSSLSFQNFLLINMLMQNSYILDEESCRE